MEKTQNHAKILEMAYIAMFAVIITVCAWITIPLPGVPFTLQTFSIFCAALVLGGKKSLISVIVYILLGAVGLPVFSSFNSGVGALLGVTGGYIIGFIFIPITYWLATSLFGKNTLVSVISLIVGLAICYAFGTVWFVYMYSRANGAIGVFTALSKCVFPFIIPDLVKLAVALAVSKAVAKYAKIPQAH